LSAARRFAGYEISTAISEEAMNDCEFAIGASDERFWNIVAIQDLERRRFVHLGVEIYRAVRCVVIPP
jgi:hypothetical protein